MENEKEELSINRLAEIAAALNQNIQENKKREKEDRIGTDVYIRKFGITRKTFSKYIKGTGIEYNKSTFMYDIPEDCFGNNKVICEESLQKSDQGKPVKVYNKNLVSAPDTLKEISELIEPIKEMLAWYKNHTDENIIDVPELNVNGIKELDGDVVTKSFKVYSGVHERFAAFAVKRKETQKDLLSLALVEFMNKYDR